jgi:hypothetical protein
MKLKYFSSFIFLIGILMGYAFNRPYIIPDVPCGDNKFWFIYNGATVVQEDSNQPAQATAAKNSANYVRLQNLTQCDGEILYCAICATASAANPSQPNLSSGTTERTEIDKYINSSQTHNPQVIIEKPSN